MNPLAAQDPDTEEADSEAPVDGAGPVILAAAVGVTVLLCGTVLWPPPAVSVGLTRVGSVNFRPEHDVRLYLGGGLASVLLAALFATWSRHSDATRRSPVAVAVGLGAIATATAAFVSLRPAVTTGGGRAALATAAAALIAACILTARLTAPGASLTNRQVTNRVVKVRGKRVPLLRGSLGPLDLVAPLIVVAVVYIPGWAELAGNSFAGEELLHLDFFAMGPAYAFTRGAALGTDVFTYYGVGWPLILAGLRRLVPLTYANIVRVEVLYGCAYFIGVYALLRSIVGSARLALAGTNAAIVMQLFAFFPGVIILWRFPSATIARWAFDVWFFLLLAAHLRARRPALLVAAAAVAGAAVVLQTDTGLFLGATLALFWACLWRLDEAERRPAVLAASVAVAGAVVVVGLGVASRWTLLSQRFWVGWLQNLREGSAGATLLPLSATPGTDVIVVFVVMVVTYLAVGAYAISQVVRDQRRPATLLLGCISLYGFATLLYFVGRSHPYNLLRPSVPFVVVVTGCAGLALARARKRWGPRHRPTGAVLWSVTALSVVALFTNPGVRNYPGLARTLAGADPPAGTCAFAEPRDLCGLPPGFDIYVSDLKTVAARVRVLREPDQTMAVLDATGPLLYRMADSPTWGRYLPMFAGLFTVPNLQAVLDDFATRPPDLVVMRATVEQAAVYGDLWTALRGPVERDYTLDTTAGLFQVWRRR